MRAFRFFLLAAVCVASTLNPPSIRACSCHKVDSMGALLHADVVFTGTTLSAVNPLDGTDAQIRSSNEPVYYRFSVDHMYKGPRADTLLVISASGGASCGYGFLPGTRYLVYAFSWNDTLHTGLCTHNAPIERAAEDLAFLSGIPVQGTAAAVDSGLAAAAHDSLDDPSPKVRSRALRVFRATADSVAAKRALLAALEDPSPWVREDAIEGWSTFLRRGSVPLAPILPALRSPDPDLRRYVAFVLASARYAADSAAAALEPLIRDPDPDIRKTVATTLHYLNPDTPPASDLLLTMWANDPSGRVRAAALQSLPLGSPPTEEATSRLRLAVRDSSAEVRGTAATLLAYPVLQLEVWSGVLRVGLLTDTDPRVRHAAAISLAMHGIDLWRRVPMSDILPALAEAVEDTTFAVYTAAFDILGMTGRREVIPILIQSLYDPRELISICALRALGDLGPVARPAVPEIRRFRSRVTGRERWAADAALDRIEGGSGP